MRVLWISKASVTASYRKKIAGLARLGVTATVVTGNAWGPWQFEAASDDCLYRLIRLPQRLSNRNHFHWYSGLAQVVHSVKPDLIHVDEEHYSTVTYQAARLARRYDIPFMFQTWQNIYKSYPPPFSAMQHYVFEHAVAALAGTSEIEAVVRRQGFQKPVFIVPLGVDADTFFPDPQPEWRSKFHTEDRFAVGFIGRLVPEKGILDLTDALLPRLSLHRDWHWVIAGSGPLQASLASRLAPYGSKVTFLPWIGTLDMARLMNSLDVLVVPSKTTPRWKEQFGRVLIEAMAVKLPVVAYDSGAIASVVGPAGILVKEGDVQGLGEALLKLFEVPDEARRLGQLGLERIQSEFTQERVSQRILAAYEAILSG